MKKEGLTPRQKRFVEEYLVDLNGTQAAIRAGYSARTANEQAAQLLAKLSIQKAVAVAKKKQAKRTEVTADMVIAGLLDEATNTGEGSSHSARVQAWTQLGKHLGLLGDKLTVSGDSEKPLSIHVRETIVRTRDDVARLAVNGTASLLSRRNGSL